MELLLEPSVWIGLLTLIILEIVLGIDNLVFIAILADKLPPHQRDKARILGLSLALLMRLGLLAAISWIVSLTRPLFTLLGFSFSGRDLILLGGGIFLVFKATVELHERLEGHKERSGPQRAYAGFWLVVMQIIVLDAVFSLDAVITAVGMVDHLSVMMAAVIIAMTVMIIASKPLTAFVNAHPTVIVLCLSFLLMIGFSLIADGFGYHIPKGYLYAAIGFSVLIEGFNQVAWRNAERQELRAPMRERTADAILRLLGASHISQEETIDEPDTDDPAQPFLDEERYMISGVLTLADRSLRTIMTPRADISWVNCDSPSQDLRRQLLDTPHSLFPVCRGELDNIIGVARAKDLLAAVDSGLDPALVAEKHPALMVPDRMDPIRALNVLRKAKGNLVLVVDEFGLIQGLITPLDILEAIAGEFPDADEVPDIVRDADGWRVKGSTDIHQLELTLGISLAAPESNFYTLAGLLLEQHEEIPAIGEAFQFGDFRFQVIQVSERRIEMVRIFRYASADDPEPGQ